MDKLSTLINELCPSGIEYKTLNEIANYRRGSFPQPYGQASWYGGEGAMPFVQVADVTDTFKLVDETKQTISKLAQPKSIFVPKGTVIVTLQGTLGRVAITQYDSYVDRTLAIFESFKIDNIDKKYFAYQLKAKFDVEKQHARGSTLKTITKEEFSKFAIPVPPMEVQCEIVRILDNFTELTAELTAELSARKKQYEYYRDKAIKTCKSPKYYKLEEIANIYDGTHATPKYVNNGIPFISVENINNIYGSTKYITSEAFSKYKVKPQIDDVFMTRIGSIGTCAIFDKQEDIAYYVSLALIRPNTNVVLSKYLKYIIESSIGRKELYKRTLINAVPIKINKGDIGKLKLPIPSINEQESIVSILDRFDKLCNDISEGLPAEIEARKKQYEYYRDKLLTFEPIQSTEKELA